MSSLSAPIFIHLYICFIWLEWKGVSTKCGAEIYWCNHYIIHGVLWCHLWNWITIMSKLSKIFFYMNILFIYCVSFYLPFIDIGLCQPLCLKLKLNVLKINWLLARNSSKVKHTSLHWYENNKSMHVFTIYLLINVMNTQRFQKYISALSLVSVSCVK